VAVAGWEGSIGLSSGKRSYYRHIDAALVRATAQSRELIVGLWPESDDGAGVDQWCAWLAQVWAPVAEAVTVASPVLASHVAAACAGRRPRASQARSMAMSLARYLVRMRGRATPFGLFAGVAPLRFDQEPSAHWSGSHQARVKADAVWLAGVIDRLESCPSLRRRLTVMVNDLAFVRGGRLVVPWQSHAGKPDRKPLTEVSVRHSRALQTVVRGARSSIRVGDLLDKLAAEIPWAAAAAVDVMLAELVARGFLITSLRLRSTSTDGLAYVLDQLEAVQAGTVEEVASLVEKLHGIQAQIDVANRSASWLDGRARRVAAERMRDRIGWGRAAAEGGSPARLHGGVASAGCGRSRESRWSITAAEPEPCWPSCISRLSHQLPRPVWGGRSDPGRAARRPCEWTRVSLALLPA